MTEKEISEKASRRSSSVAGSVTPMQEKGSAVTVKHNGDLEKLDEPELMDDETTTEKPLDDPKPVPVLKLFRFADKVDL
ncbi:hypothetical protein H4R24_003648, partial [Coemansia sp. RSA 988]